jgi:5-methylcytosine-specific restriction endonuclease McrA
MSKRVLLLTPWYFPTKILRWQDAVKMVYEETVDVVAEYDEEIRSPSVTWKVPAVVRLRRMAPSSKRAVKFSRRNVYQRDGYRCQYCGEKKHASDLSYDLDEHRDGVPHVQHAQGLANVRRGRDVAAPRPGDAGIPAARAARARPRDPS